MWLKFPVLVVVLLGLSSCLLALHSDLPPYGQAKNAKGELVNRNILPFPAAEGRKLLAGSIHNNDFFELAPHFQPQQNPVYCGVASGVIVANALRLKTRKVLAQPTPFSLAKPLIWGGGTLPLYEYVQGTFLADEKGVKEKAVIEAQKKTKDKKGKEIYDPGIALGEFADILRAKGFAVTVKYAGEISAEEFEADLLKTVDDTDHYLVANFKGEALGALTGGHISPLVAVTTYQNEKYVLDLDVAAHKNPWYWVPLKDMFKAMNTSDDSSGKTRGYVIVSDPR